MGKEFSKGNSGLRNERGETTRTRATTVVARDVEVLQDLYWDECIAAATLSDRYKEIESFREAITDAAFTQPSFQTRHRYASYFLKWFVPHLTFDDPVPVCWAAFRQRGPLEDVMRWQYITSNPLVASYVDHHLSHVSPGEPVDDGIESFLATATGTINEKTKNRLRSNLRKIGLVTVHSRTHYRVIPDVSTESVALLLAILFAPQAQTVSMDTILHNPWWRRVGLANEVGVTAKLRETAEAGLIARLVKMDTLDQVTTRYSFDQLRAGKVRRK